MKKLQRLDEGKLYYSISEVAAITGLEQHVLRYWESEFPQLKPKKNRSGNRAYRAKEIKIIRYIKYLLYDEKYTIPGGKKKMSEADAADIEGQQVLIRVPPTPIPQSPTLQSTRLESGEGPGSNQSSPTGSLAGNGLGYTTEMEAAHLAEITKLKQELAQMKSELKSLLSALQSSGRLAR